MAMFAGGKKTAVTLLELVIAISILAFIAIVFISALRSTGREIKFSGEHFTGFFLSQKVTQDLSEEIRVNPHAFSTLGIDQSSGVSAEITDGSSVFFSNVEFAGTQAPRKIDNTMIPLYKQVKPFHLAVSARRQPSVPIGSPGNLFSSSIQFNWDALTGKGVYTTDCMFFAPLEMKAFQDSLQLDQNAIAQEFRAFYKRSPDSPPMVQLARVHYVLKQFLQSEKLKNSLNTVETLKSALEAIAPGNTEDLYNTRLKMAKTWYEIAQSSFYAMAIIERDLTGYAQANTLPATHPYLRRTQKNCVMTFRTFCAAIDNARFHFSKLLEGNLAAWKGSKQMNRTLVRLLDIHKVLACIPYHYYGGFDPQKTRGQCRSFLNSLETYSLNRNPFLNRYAQQESTLLTDASQMFTRYPQLDFVRKVLHEGMGGFLSRMAPSVLVNVKEL